MQAHADLKNEKASILSLAYYPLSSPILSMAFIDVEEHDFNDESPTKTPYVVDYFSDPENTRQQGTIRSVSNLCFLVDIGSKGRGCYSLLVEMFAKIRYTTVIVVALLPYAYI